MTSPSPVPSHRHYGMHCPVTSSKYGYCPQQDGDSRSPCPALNAMANHGYIPRDGKKVGMLDLIQGLRDCYGLSMPLAIFLTLGGFFLLKRLLPVSLLHIGKHGAIEHNASLVHEDCPKGEEYAPITPHEKLVDHLMNSSSEESARLETAEEQMLLGVEDLAKYRVWRESRCAPLDKVHAEIARGEMALIFGVWDTKSGSKSGVSKAWLRDWFLNGRLPESWRPDGRRQGLFDTMERSNQIRDAMNKLKRGSTTTLTSEKQKKVWG